MRLRILPMVLLVFALCMIAANAPADRGVSADEPYPVDLSVGETFEVCGTGEIICPATAPICDDPKVSVPVDTPNGLGFRGAGPGTTLCSAVSVTRQRRIFRITVR